ncbi:thiosulfate oxidation carrier protein SoxY [Planktotalea sp.]|uniref:thiosulfate oxidation carrier protein SoxY n=1 Tax=Planktotalea sp. TaxID=2029877 RepID=UPI0032975BAE
MELTRRNAIIMGAAGALFLNGLPTQGFAAAGEEAIAAFTGGADVAEGDLKLTAPEIAENGNTVPIEVSSGSAAEIMVLAMGNPTPNVATFKFGKLAASRAASTRIRLAGTQDVIAIAKLDDGSFVKASSTVKVTIGGCGG